jgi:hypothetical protein
VSTGGIDEGSGEGGREVAVLAGSAVAVAGWVGFAVGEVAAGRVAVATCSAFSSFEPEEQPAARASARARGMMKGHRLRVNVTAVPLVSSVHPC